MTTVGSGRPASSGGSFPAGERRIEIGLRGHVRVLAVEIISVDLNSPPEATIHHTVADGHFVTGHVQDAL